MIVRYLVLALSVIIIIALVYFMFFSVKPTEISYSNDIDGDAQGMVQRIENGSVKALYIESYKVYALVGEPTQKEIEAFYKNPTKKANYFATIDYRTNFKDYLESLRTEEGMVVPQYVFNDPNSGVNISSLIFPILALILCAVVVFIIFRQNAGANRQALDFGKTKARLNMNVNVRFTDVAGAEEEKEELQEIVEFLKDPDKFLQLGARIPKGVLLVGPPGTGKTLFAKAVAGESNVPFFSISGSDFVEMFVGTGAARVRDLFNQAKKNMPCIIFIDEIDAVGRQRGSGLGGGHDEREQTLNQLLVQMDGFEKNDGIIIMAATNRADILDPALLRPGRFDRQIYVNVPDVKGREEILRVHARNKKLADDVSFKTLARMTSGFSGADLENLLNESAILAARANRKVIIMEDILEGINKVIAGPQKKSRIVTDSDKRITAYHESGHAIIGKLLENCDDVQEVSIIPRGMAAGYTLTRPENDDSHITRNKLIDMITMMLGGRAAEEIVIKDISTGASNDIERASNIAKKMVTQWGMSKAIGNMYLGGDKEVFLGRDYGTTHSYSDELGGVIDNEIKTILDTCYKKALEILQANRLIMDNMVKVLFEKETIYTEEVNMLFDGKTAEEVIAYIDEKQAKKESYKNGPTINIVPENKPVEPQQEQPAPQQQTEQVQQPQDGDGDSDK
ncbi:MAG: ATP-dependent zinc metalloprotease FtsH [Clostridia bacterium]|nr:ATP-dependent zinc metalloprotease FtsH [Clostridia bacterium]MDE7328579.1 ATP-dependent zinc metalloprotease FtsH [Clostridia bacterium]